MKCGQRCCTRRASCFVHNCWLQWGTFKQQLLTPAHLHPGSSSRFSPTWTSLTSQQHIWAQVSPDPSAPSFLQKNLCQNERHPDLKEAGDLISILFWKLTPSKRKGRRRISLPTEAERRSCTLDVWQTGKAGCSCRAQSVAELLPQQIPPGLNLDTLLLEMKSLGSREDRISQLAWVGERVLATIFRILTEWFGSHVQKQSPVSAPALSASSRF